MEGSARGGGKGLTVLRVVFSPTTTGRDHRPTNQEGEEDPQMLHPVMTSSPHPCLSPLPSLPIAVGRSPLQDTPGRPFHSPRPPVAVPTPPTSPWGPSPLWPPFSIFRPTLRSVFYIVPTLFPPRSASLM